VSKNKHKKKKFFAPRGPRNHTQKMIAWLTSGIYIFLILVGLSAAIYKDYKEKITKEIQKEIARQENKQKLSVDLPRTADIASDWRAFISDQYGFSIKYPPDWEYAVGLPDSSTSKYKAKIAFRYKPGINKNMKGLDIYVYEGEEFSDPALTNNITRKKLKINPEICAPVEDVTIGEGGYPAKEIYILDSDPCFKSAYFYSVAKGKYIYNIVPLPANGFNNLSYDGKREITRYFPEFFNILSTFSFAEISTPKKKAVTIPHRVYVAKESCAKKNDHPGKSKKGKGLHMDEDCCMDPDEWPNPRCVYSAKALSIAQPPPLAKKKK